LIKEVETIKPQTRAVYGCMAKGQSPWPRAWAAVQAVRRLCLWWQRRWGDICDNFGSIYCTWTLRVPSLPFYI